MTDNLGHKSNAISSTLQSSFLRLQRAFTPTQMKIKIKIKTGHNKTYTQCPSGHCA